MTGEPEPQGAPATPIRARAILVITFNDPDVTAPHIENHGATFGQIAAAAWFLDQWAAELRAQQLAQQELGGILSPVGLPGILRQLGDMKGSNGK